MSKKIKWVQVELDADVLVEGEELACPAAAAARFEACALALDLGWKEGQACDDDALGLALMLIERVADALRWREDPLVSWRVEGQSALARMSPGRVDEESWDQLVQAFAGVCAFYGNPHAKSAVGISSRRASREWFDC